MTVPGTMPWNAGAGGAGGAAGGISGRAASIAPVSHTSSTMGVGHAMKKVARLRQL